MTSHPRRLTMLIALVMGLSLAVAPAVTATDRFADLPTRIDLPTGFQPEGIESFGPWLFAGDLQTGSGGHAGRRQSVDPSGSQCRRSPQ